MKVNHSSIHGSGLCATRDIEQGEKVIEYIGDKVIKTESQRRTEEQMEKSAETGEGAIYAFTLNRRYDIDGNVPENIARAGNHSCDPNCQVDIEGGHIWIIAIRPIRKGEEILYNYNFDMENYEDHPCRCGAKNCVGYIVAEEAWPKLRKAIRKKKKKK